MRVPVSRRLVAQKGVSCSSEKSKHVSTSRLVAQKKRFNCSSEDKGELEWDYFPVQSSYFQHLPGKNLSFIWGFSGAYAKDDSKCPSIGKVD
jgi:hypothetical protein